MKKTMKIIIACTITLLLCFLCIGSMLLFGKETEQPKDYSVSQQVIIQDGKTEQRILEQNIPVFEEGAYTLYTEWENEQGGMITGVIFTAPDGTVEYAATADSCQAESGILQLQPGMYRLELYSLVGPNELEEFLTNRFPTAHLEELNVDDYIYAENATIPMNYIVRLRKSSSFSMGAKCGILCGILLGLLIIYIFLIMTKKDDSIRCNYDERQQEVRGKGFRNGFFTMLGYNIFIALLQMLEIPIPAGIEIIMFTGGLLGICVYAVYCIWNDAYFALNERKNTILILFAVIAVINFGVGIMNIIIGTMFQYGKITFRGLNLLCGLVFIVIFLTLLIKKCQDGKDEEL